MITFRPALLIFTFTRVVLPAALRNLCVPSLIRFGFAVAARGGMLVSASFPAHCPCAPAGHAIRSRARPLRSSLTFVAPMKRAPVKTCADGPGPGPGGVVRVAV